MKRISEHGLQSLTSTLSNMENFVFLESSKVSGQNHYSLLFTEPLNWLICKAEDSAMTFLQEVEQLRAQGKYKCTTNDLHVCMSGPLASIF